MPSSMPVVMPQLGLEVTEGTVTAVLVEVGAQVRLDQPLMELETDKAVTEVVAPCDGVVEAIDAAPGDTVPVGAVLMRLVTEAPANTTAGPVANEAPANAGTAANEAPATAYPVANEAPANAGTVANEAPAPALESLPNGTPAAAENVDASPRLRVAPVARRAAATLGVDLATITGTGPRGRITLYDVEGAAAANGSGERQPAAADGRAELTAVQRAVARRMTASQLIPQYHLERDVDATHLIAEKAAQQSRGGARPGINDLLIQAIAETVTRHPLLASSYVDDDPPYLRRADSINVGLAVATDRGLVVPVIHRAHERGLAAIAAERQRLMATARAGRLSLEEMAGGTITLSSLAALGVDRFKAMVNPGESAIVAVGRTIERLVPRGRTISVIPTLTLTLSFDHRVVDGAVGAAALGELVALLEGGMTWRP